MRCAGPRASCPGPRSSTFGSADGVGCALPQVRFGDAVCGAHGLGVSCVVTAVSVSTPSLPAAACHPAA
eukprot:3741780-Prorocentrum_lima.AAC.1